MASNDTELETEVRDFTDIDVAVVSASEFQSVLSDAKRHIKTRRSLSDTETDWYGDPAQEEALNWATKLFLKVAAGHLDSQTIQVGAIDHDTLLAKDDNEFTLWYRNMENALRKINPKTSFGVRSPARREYGDSGSDTSSGGSLNL